MCHFVYSMCVLSTMFAKRQRFCVASKKHLSLAFERGVVHLSDSSVILIGTVNAFEHSKVTKLQFVLFVYTSSSRTLNCASCACHSCVHCSSISFAKKINVYECSSSQSCNDPALVILRLWTGPRAKYCSPRRCFLQNFHRSLKIRCCFFSKTHAANCVQFYL